MNAPDKMPATRHPIHVHIERLVLDDWPASLNAVQRAHLQGAVASAIARQLSANPLVGDLSSGGALASIRGGTVRVAADSAPAALGDAIGGALAAPLARPEAHAK
jgi:hypothetical protein